MKPSHALFLTAMSLVVVTASSCTFPNGQSVGGYFIADKGLPRSPGPNRPNYGGYLVNTSGPGISPTIGSAGVGTYDPECLAIGVTTNVVSYETISTEGVKLRIPSGPNRKVEVLGVSSSLPSEVYLNQDLTKLFENGQTPALYRLAVEEGVNLYRDTRLDLKALPTGTYPVNIVEACSASVTPDEEYVEPYNSLRLISFTALPTSFLQNIAVDAGGQMTLGALDTAYLTGNPNRVALSTDRRRLVAWRIEDGANRTFSMSSSAQLTDLGAVSPTPFTGGFDLIFSPTGQYGFLDVGPGINLLTLDGGLYRPNTPNSVQVVQGVQLLTGKGRLYRISASGGNGVIDYATIPNSGAFLQDPFAEGSVSFPTTTGLSFVGNALVTYRGIYVPYEGEGRLRLLFFRLDSGGVPIRQPTVIDLGTSNVLADTRLATAPNSKWLFVYRLRMTMGSIATVSLNADGTLVEALPTELPISAFKAMAVDPASKFVAVGYDSSSAVKLSTYPIGVDGALGAATSTLVSLNNLQPEISKLVFVPVYPAR